MLLSQYLRVAKEALLDSGAMENFIYPRLVRELQLVRRKLLKPCKVWNFNRNFNKLGDITHTVYINVKHWEKGECHTFLITDIAEDDLILRYPFFKSTNPQVDWANGTILEKSKCTAMQKRTTDRSNLSQIGKKEMNYGLESLHINNGGSTTGQTSNQQKKENLRGTSTTQVSFLWFNIFRRSLRKIFGSL